MYLCSMKNDRLLLKKAHGSNRTCCVSLLCLMLAVFGLPFEMTACRVDYCAGVESVDDYSIQWVEGNQAAIAFLGYYDNFDMFKRSADYAVLCKQYPDIAKLKKFDVATGGQQTYLIIPRDKNATVAVNSYTFDMFLADDESSAEVLYRSEEGRPILVQCNVSDNLSDIHVFVTTGRTTIDFLPRLDLNSHSMVFMPGVQDITPKGVFPLAEKVIEVQDFFSKQGIGINVMLKNGCVAIYYDPEVMNRYRYLPQRTLAGWVTLKGINGYVKDIYVGDIGQDINPVIGMLMNDGTVKSFSIFDAEGEADLHASGALEGMKGIVRFSKNSNDKVERDYVTFFAVDAKGKHYEMEVGD